MAFTASRELKYESMKSAMRRIFVDCERQVVGTNSSEIKEEPVYLTSAGQKRNGFHQKFADQRDRLYSKGPKQQGRNPLGKDGRITRCSYCGSVNHWYRNCPDRDTNVGETVDVVESVDIVETGCNKSAVVLYNRSDVDPPQRIAEFWTPHVLRAYVVTHGLADLSDCFLRLQEKWLRKSIPKRNLCLEMENHHGRNTRFGCLLKYALLDVL